jgi:hypothetical protein
MATERGRGIGNRTLVRVWGSDPARIARILGAQDLAHWPCSMGSRRESWQLI